MKTIVSFNSEFPTVSKNEMPVGFELSQYIHQAFIKFGYEILEPNNREGWAWDFVVQKDGFQIEAILGYVNDDSLQWLITTHAHLSLISKLLNRKVSKEKSTLELNHFCTLINDILSSEKFNHIRWYTQDSFDSNELDKWSSSPLV